MAFSKCLRSCMALACTLPLLAVAAPSAPGPVYGEELQGFEYPYPLHRFEFNSQGQPVQMGYMDIAPSGQANGRTAVLMHGKNFCAATWGDSIKALSAAGYRVVADLCVPHDSYFRPALKQQCRDGFCPIADTLAPVSPAINPDALDIEVLVDGVVRQRASTTDLFRPVARLIADGQLRGRSRAQ